MTAPTMSQVHIPTALDNFSIAYRNESYIGMQVFPEVPVQKQQDKYFVYDKADWFRNEAGPRAPGTRGPEQEYSISTSSYACVPIAFTKVVPDEIVDNADNAIRPRQEAIEFATDKLLLYVEVEVAADVFGAGWTSSATPTTTWDNDASDPLADIEVGRETVVGLIGREPNMMVIGREVWTDLKWHPDLIDLAKYTQNLARGPLSIDNMAAIFGVEKFLVGRAIYTTSAEGATTTMSKVWGKHGWMGYVPSRPSLMQPAAGYVVTWKTRTVERFRRGEEKADAYRAEMHFDSIVTCPDAGYLFKSCVA